MGKRHIGLDIWWPDQPESWGFLRRYLIPHPGTFIMTLLVVGGLLWTSSVGALPLRAPAAATTSTGTIAYQGRLADSAGNPITGTYGMIFRLYDAASGGVPLWEEQWTGSNGVEVSDGLFNVMLGSVTQIPQNVITEHDTLWLGITVGTDDEMTPRVQLGSVPFAVQALSVPDGSVSTAKLANGAVTSAKIQDGQVGTTDLANNAVNSANIQDGEVGNADLANNVVTSVKIQDGAVGTADLDSGAVTSAKIADNTITEADIADNFKARDADKLDGKNSTDFAYSSHNHDGRYFTESESDGRFVNASGDTMSGTLGANGGIQIGGQSFVGGNLGDSFLQIPRKDFDPGNPVNGMIYYNNAANCLRIYAKGAWRNLQCW